MRFFTVQTDIICSTSNIEQTQGVSKRSFHLNEGSQCLDISVTVKFYTYSTVFYLTATHVKTHYLSEVECNIDFNMSIGVSCRKSVSVLVENEDYTPLANSMAYETRKFNAAITRALQ